MLNKNLEKAHKPYEHIIDRQFFPFGYHTKFAQCTPSKPKYVIKVFQACNTSNAYPPKSKIYHGTPTDDLQLINIGEQTVLILLSLYNDLKKKCHNGYFFHN